MFDSQCLLSAWTVHGQKARPATPLNRAHNPPLSLVGRFRFRLLKALFVLGRQLRRFDRDSQLVDLAGELERRLAVLIVDRRAGIRPDVGGLIPGQRERRAWVPPSIPEPLSGMQPRPVQP